MIEHDDEQAQDRSSSRKRPPLKSTPKDTGSAAPILSRPSVTPIPSHIWKTALTTKSTKLRTMKDGRSWFAASQAVLEHLHAEGDRRSSSAPRPERRRCRATCFRVKCAHVQLTMPSTENGIAGDCDGAGSAAGANVDCGGA